MDQIQCVSLPRSGHNLLVSHLQKYFDSDMQCESLPKKRLPFFSPVPAREKDTLIADRFHYCEYYYACRSTPCVNSINTFQKSHDFELQLPVDLHKKHIIQYRNPIGLLISWFEMRLLKNREVDTADGFKKFASRNQGYIDGFCAKWIDADIPHRLMLDYEKYLSEPIESLSEVIRFFNTGQGVDLEHLRAITRDILPAKDNTAFRFYDAAQDAANTTW